MLGEIYRHSVKSFAECISACASTAGRVDASLSGSACYLKKSMGKAVYNGVLGARLVSAGGPISTSSSTSSSSSKSTSSPAATTGLTLASITSITSYPPMTASTPISASATPTPNHPSPSGFSYQGCYTEVPGRALSAKSTSSQTMTNGACTSFCASFAWFAIEYASQRFCGNVLSPSSTPAADDRCRMACAGNATEKYGGPNGLGLFVSLTVSPQGPPAVVPSVAAGGYMSLGCYTDNTGGVRALADLYADSTAMTIESCAARAWAGAYSFFGVEYGAECWMGKTLASSAQPLPQSSCSCACPGNTSEFCGAGNALQLYSNAITGSVAKERRAVRVGGFFRWEA